MKTERYCLNKMNNAFSLIDKLQEEENCFSIDLFPQPIESEEFYTLESFFLTYYLTDFSAKISRIILKLIHYYEAEIYLTEFPEEALESEYSGWAGENLRKESLESLDRVIRFVIEKDQSSVQVLFRKENFVVSINGEFSVSIFGLKNDYYPLLSSLVTQESLFLR